MASDREDVAHGPADGPEPQVRVLIVDGFPLMLAGLAEALARAPIAVIGEAHDGFDAVERARLLRPDVVLLDLAVPGLDGPAGIARLRAHDPALRIVAMGVDDDPGQAAAARGAGASRYVSRRSDVEILRQAILASLEEDAEAGAAAGAPSPAAPGPDPWAGLSAREQEVVALIAQGLTDREIADRLAISTRTVHNHVERIREKTGLRRRAQLSGWATERRMAAERGN